MNPCHHHPCLNHGHCHFAHHQQTQQYHFKCACNKGFQGHYCEISPYSCHPNPCHHGGECTKTKTLVFCSCPNDYKGHHCEIEKACVENPCLNDGICHETSEGFHCQCEQGWQGHTCEDRILICESSNPCKNGATCHDLEEDGHFECQCPIGYGCIDCSCPMDSPVHQSSISTTELQSTQTLLPGGESTTTKQDTSTSLVVHEGGCPPTFCHNGGVCLKGSQGYTCNCKPGFHGLFCDVPDLCTPNPCDNNAICLQDGDENYKCICKYGFKGSNCQLKLSCTGHPCMNGATCVETTDSYQCKCSTGYKGLKCSELSPCSHNPCQNKGTCFEKGSMYTCTCKKGYRGHTCLEKDPCFPNPCGVNGQCLERSGGAVICKCNQGWLGQLCDVEDLCHQGTHCMNGATCVYRESSEFKCLCADGFHGDSCELQLPCHDSPCENGGMCEVTGGSYTCKCVGGFHGENCHLQSHCYPSPCLNNGACFESQNGYVCQCTQGYMGRICQEEKLCHNNPCLNGGRCHEIDDVLHCKCALGFFGRICDINVCDHNPCRNGGTCMPASNDVGYACECVFPYHGRQCDEMDACVPNPCRHGGTCQSHLQHVQDLSFHEGPQFHGTDESVVSVVGPIMNETIHHEPLYNMYDHSMEFVPDEHVLSSEVHHFHMTQDDPDHIFEKQIYHAKNVEGYHDYHDHDYLGGHHVGLYPNHHFQDDLASHHQLLREGVAKRNKVVQPNVRNRTQRSLYKRRPHHHKRHHVPSLRHYKNGKRSKQGHVTVKRDRIPQVMISIRDPKTSVVKRTLHDMYVCQCRVGFLGAHCQHLNPCDSNPCHNHGICVPRGELYQCQCVNGYGGNNCDDPHPCLPNPCLHGGKCLLGRNTHGYLCDCTTEWRGQNCESRDLCSIHNPCLHGGVCVNSKDEDNKVTCKCRARFSGDRCENDKCANCDINAYCHHGNCMCKPEFVGNGYVCKAIGDVCAPNPCENGGQCRHGVDGKLFSCECPHGFLGIRCELPNPCANSPCLHNGACIDESSSKEKGILMADRHDYKCFCTPGYRGKNCEETNLAACSSGPCKNNGFCFDASSESHKRHLAHPDDYECFCPNGFAGKDCEYEHYPCVSSPCMNGGHCLDAQKLPAVSFDAHGYKCSCNHGFAGRNCEVTVEGLGACHSDPCMHDGRCVDIINTNDPDLHFDYDHEFKCFCSALYSGILCEVPYPACHSQPCQHNGTCFDKTTNMEILYDDTGYECKCSPGFEGKNCERQYALNVLDDDNYDHALSEGALFDNYHPTHNDRDYDAEDVENSPARNPLIETGNYKEHHVEDHLEDEDPYHGLVVDHVKSDKKPIVIKEEVIMDEPSKQTEEVVKIVDHKLNEAHGESGPQGGESVKVATVGVSSNLKGKKIVNMKEAAPTRPTPTHDSVAHHSRLSFQKYDFPNRNPSPTVPIVLKANLAGEPSFGDEAEMVAEENHGQEVRTETASARTLKKHNFVRSSLENTQKGKLSQQQVTRKNSDSHSELNDKRTLHDASTRPVWNQIYNNAMRVYYGRNGAQSAIAKKK
ncbi:fibropellin-1-like isoform X2 [Clytia hemisphaerica]